MNKKIIAPCGVDCFNCELYEENVTPELQARLAAAYQIPASEISCKGCYDGNQCLLLDVRGVKCKTLECVNQKQVNYCFECDSFPCAYLMPLADRASQMPHNLKVYNLCRMKCIGVEAWSEEVANTRNIYFNKKIVIGEGGAKN